VLEVVELGTDMERIGDDVTQEAVEASRNVKKNTRCLLRCSQAPSKTRLGMFRFRQSAECGGPFMT